jgi:DNA-binding transcriptional LysR family regulator
MLPKRQQQARDILLANPPDPLLDKPARKTRPRERALSPGLLARVFHQPSLIYFIEVARYLSIREAARQLNVASSAVTRQINQLEDALGIALFHRERQRLRLSIAGEILYMHSQRLMAPMEAAVSELEMLRGIKTGTVRIATVESVGLSFLPALITEFGAKYPRLTLEVLVVSSAAVIDLLATERADLGFGFISAPLKRVDVSDRRDVPIGVLMHPDHPLAGAKDLTIADCITHPIAVAKPEISIREVIQPFLNKAAATSLPLVEASSIRLLVELACGGHYLSIMTPIGAQNELADGKLIFKPLRDRGLPTNQFGILVRSLAGLQFAPAVFYEHAKIHFQALSFPGEK